MYVCHKRNVRVFQNNNYANNIDFPSDIYSRVKTYIGTDAVKMDLC
uniref:Uncharacterized protein n=1 Tax=Anguilla anguilla TaxID=7936 RepID=A0A0E9UV16_ANGAN